MPSVLFHVVESSCKASRFKDGNHFAPAGTIRKGSVNEHNVFHRLLRVRMAEARRHQSDSDGSREVEFLRFSLLFLLTKNPKSKRAIDNLL